MQSQRKFHRWKPSPLGFFMGLLAVLLAYIVVAAAYNQDAKAQQFIPDQKEMRYAPATLGIVLVDPETGAARAFACAPVPVPQQQEQYR